MDIDFSVLRDAARCDFPGSQLLSCLFLVWMCLFFAAPRIFSLSWGPGVVVLLLSFLVFVLIRVLWASWTWIWFLIFPRKLAQWLCVFQLVRSFSGTPVTCVRLFDLVSQPMDALLFFPLCILGLDYFCRCFSHTVISPSWLSVRVSIVVSCVSTCAPPTPQSDPTSGRLWVCFCCLLCLLTAGPNSFWESGWFPVLGGCVVGWCTFSSPLSPAVAAAVSLGLSRLRLGWTSPQNPGGVHVLHCGSPSLLPWGSLFELL